MTATDHLLRWTHTPLRVTLSLAGRTASIRRDALLKPGALTGCARSISFALACDQDAVLDLLVGVRLALGTARNPNEEQP